MLTGSQPPFVPTEEQIAEACRQIQAGWTAEEEQRRRTFFTGGRELGIKVLDTTELRRLGVDMGAE